MSLNGKKNMRVESGMKKLGLYWEKVEKGLAVKGGDKKKIVVERESRLGSVVG